MSATSRHSFVDSQEVATTSDLNDLGDAQDALEIATGRVITDIRPRHTSADFVAFLSRVNRNVPAELDVHVILDKPRPTRPRPCSAGCCDTADSTFTPPGHSVNARVSGRSNAQAPPVVAPPSSLTRTSPTCLRGAHAAMNQRLSRAGEGPARVVRCSVGPPTHHTVFPRSEHVDNFDTDLNPHGSPRNTWWVALPESARLHRRLEPPRTSRGARRGGLPSSPMGSAARIAP